MTQIAPATAAAVETLKRIAKPIPFAARDDVAGELRNIQALMATDRVAEARERMTRLFDSGYVKDGHSLPGRVCPTCNKHW